jgi:hypothetical protein
MERRSIALGVIAVGVVMVLIALLADTLGIGESGFGWRRGLFLAVGVVVALAGVAYMLMPPRAGVGEDIDGRSAPGDDVAGPPAQGADATGRPSAGERPPPPE